MILFLAHRVYMERPACAGLGASLVVIVAVIWKCVLARQQGSRSEPCRLLVDVSDRVTRPSCSSAVGLPVLQTSGFQRRVQSSSASRTACYRHCDYAYWSAGQFHYLNCAFISQLEMRNRKFCDKWCRKRSHLAPSGCTWDTCLKTKRIVLVTIAHLTMLETWRSIHERSYDSSPTYAGRTTLIPYHLLFTKHGAPTNGVNMSVVRRAACTASAD